MTFIKTILITMITFLLTTIMVTAEIPQVINYQGNLTESDGTPSDGPFLIKFTIYDSPTGGTILWDGNFQTITVTNGLFEVQLGASPMPAIPGNLFNVNSTCYLGITVGTDQEIVPRIMLTSVAYAYQSLRSDSSGYSSQSAIAADANLLDGKDATDFADVAHTHNVTTAEITNGTILFEDLNQNSAGLNQVMKWDGNSWVAANDEVKKHTGAIYRWNTFSTYANNYGWMMNNNADMFGGINPSSWTDGGYLAGQMSTDKEVLRTLFTRKGYGGKNAMVVADVFIQYSSTNGKITAVLFRIKNTIGSVIDWIPQFYYSCYYSWSERASVALNGANIWHSGSTSSYPTSNVSVTLSIPPNQTSTVIVVSASGPALPVSFGQIREHKLGFFNNSLELPLGLEYVDDLDIAQ